MADHVELKNAKKFFLGDFWRKKVFQKEKKKKKWARSRTSPYERLAPYQISEKTNKPISRKLPQRTD